MAFDFKKEYKELYAPATKPSIVTVPVINYIAIRGKGNPNIEDGEYKQAIKKLYGVAYAIRMSYKGDYQIDGFYKFVVPPLEGFWWQDNVDGVDYSSKDSFNWISVIRLPDFVTKDALEWAKSEATRKKNIDCSNVEYLTVDEGLCVQIMHIGSFDTEPDSIALMEQYIEENGYINNISSTRRHHEIYLSDTNKVPMEKWKTIIRHPVSRAN